jgi:hypothetical protein
MQVYMFNKSLIKMKSISHVRGGPLEKWWGGGAKIKIEQGKQKKKMRAPENFEKKIRGTV